MANLVDSLITNLLQEKISRIRAGDTITVYYEIKEGEKLELSF
jgi:ribosomal protein L19